MASPEDFWQDGSGFSSVSHLPTLLSFHCGSPCPTLELRCLCRWLFPWSCCQGTHILYHQLTLKCFCGCVCGCGGRQRRIRCHLKTLCPVPRPVLLETRTYGGKGGELLLTSHLAQCITRTMAARSSCRHVLIVPSFLVLTGETMSLEYICMLITLSLCIWEFLSREE